MSLSNLIRFSFFDIESEEEEIGLIAAAIHSLKKRINNGDNKEIYRKKRSALVKPWLPRMLPLRTGDTLLNELRIEKHSVQNFLRNCGN